MDVPVLTVDDLLPELRTFSLGTHPLRPHPPSMTKHRHGNYLELVVVTDGRGAHLFEADTFPIETGDVFVVPVNALHGYADGKNLGIINVLFDPRTLPLPEAYLMTVAGYKALFALEPQLRSQHAFKSRLHLEGEELRGLVALCDELHRELCEKRDGFQVEGVALLSRILVRLSRAYAEMSGPLSQTLVRLSALLEWLDHHFADPITLELLAKRAHMSPRTLARCFHECFDMSPMNYVIDVRLRRAEQMLCSAEARVKDVAPKVGIEDASYFARLFRKRTGLEPSAYRVKHRQRAAPRN